MKTIIIDGIEYNLTPKAHFKKDDWITNGYYTWKVTDIKPLDYILQSPNGDVVDDTISYVDENLYLWTIQDAKDGDVLASNRSIFIFNQEYMAGKPEAHCGIMNGLFIEKPEGCWTNEKCYPATKEQRDLLLQKMNDAGYEWDAEKKELKKIKQKPTWSEEDEEMLDSIIDCLDGLIFIDSDQINWLKSLKPNHWKPSKEQMSMLLAVLNDPNNITSESVYIALKLLYNDLKKL